MDAAPESFADAWVGGARGQLVDGKRETHRHTRPGGTKGEPIVQVHDILIPVPIPIGDVVTHATHLLDALLAPLEPLCHVSLLCHAPSSDSLVPTGDRTPHLLVCSGVILGCEYIAVPLFVDDTSDKESGEGTIGQAPR